VQWSVTRRVACIHICSIEQKLFQVLDQSIPTCLYTNLISETLWYCSDFCIAVTWVITPPCNVVQYFHLQGKVNGRAPEYMMSQHRTPEHHNINKPSLLWKP
jgi:hypothetical protein